MFAKARHTPSVLWLFLIALTVSSFAIFEGQLLGPLSTLVIAMIAAAKVRLVIMHYMEASRARRTWRVLYQAWCVAVAAIIIVGHYSTGL